MRCARKFFSSFCLLITTVPRPKNLPCLCYSPQRRPPPMDPPRRPMPPMPSKHWGAFSAPRLPFPQSSDPRKDARQCRLTLALPLRGSLVISGGIPSCGLRYPWAFVNSLPVPAKTRATGCDGYHVQVRVTLENPRVARDITYQSYTLKLITLS